MSYKYTPTSYPESMRAADILDSLTSDPVTQSRAKFEDYMAAVNRCVLPEEADTFLMACGYAMAVASQCNQGERALMVARRAWDYLKPLIDTPQLTELTQRLYRLSTRSCTNTIAWYEHEKTDDPVKLQELLDLVNIGCQSVTDKDGNGIMDTKTRILLKLGRKEEAFAIARECAETGQFDDIIEEDPEYAVWLAKQA